MNKSIFLSLAIVAVAATGLAACQNKSAQNMPANQTPGQQMQQGASQFGQGAAAAGTHAANSANQYASDTAVTAKVKAALAANAGLKTLALNVTTQNGVVTLSGTVDTQSQKDLAERVTQQVSGVQSVDNNLEVKSGG